MQRDRAERWVVWFFAISGAFFLCGLCGAGFGYVMGWGDETVSGFFAVFGVVVLAYLAAPRRPSLTASVTFLVGAMLAWGILKPHIYSVNMGTYWVTVLGGVLALLFCVSPNIKSVAKHKVNGTNFSP